MELIKINPSEKTSKELLTIIDDNIKTTRTMAKQIKTIQAENSQAELTISLNEPTMLPTAEVIEEDESFEEAISFFLKKIDLLDEVSKEALEENLPDSNDYDYEKILLRLTAELLRKNVELLSFIQEEDLSPSDIVAFENELTKNKEKISLLRNLITIKEMPKESQEEEVRNKLIFVPNSSGSPIVLNELKHIDSAYYEGFLGLFDSIRTGKFKNFARLTANNAGYGIFEVKDLRIRVFFSRLGPTEYAVISAFTKKVQSSRGYNELISLRASDYRKVEASLKASLGNEEFLKLNADYEQELDRLLGRTSEKAKVKEKKSDQND